MKHIKLLLCAVLFFGIMHSLNTITYTDADTHTNFHTCANRDLDSKPNANPNSNSYTHRWRIWKSYIYT